MSILLKERLRNFLHMLQRQLISKRRFNIFEAIMQEGNMISKTTVTSGVYQRSYFTACTCINAVQSKLSCFLVMLYDI